MRPVLAAFCLLLATSCDEKSPTGPTVAFSQQVTLAPGQTATVSGADVRLQFVDVSGDSRCPADAVCIQGGDAIVHVRAAGGGDTAIYDLHTGDTSRASAVHHNVRFTLRQLSPYPFSGQTTAPQDYRATLEVTRP